MKTIEELIRENKEKDAYNMFVRTLLETLQRNYGWYEEDKTEDAEINLKAIMQLATDISKLSK